MAELSKWVDKKDGGDLVSENQMMGSSSYTQQPGWCSSDQQSREWLCCKW